MNIKIIKGTCEHIRNAKKSFEISLGEHYFPVNKVH
jgi:hypothetical protein